MSINRNPWLVYLSDYKKSHPTLSYGDAMKKASESYKKLSPSQKNSLSSKGIQVKKGGGKKRQKGRGDDDLDDMDFDAMQLDDPQMDYGYDNMDYQSPQLAPVRNVRKEARDTRFMTRKMMNQLIKLKKKNDKHKLGYTIEQLKDMAVRGVNI